MKAYEAVKAARLANDNDSGPAQKPGACAAYGCPCNGTIDLGSTGRFFCGWHGWALPDRWQDITAQLHEYRWLIDFIGELMRLRDSKHAGSWAARACEFFHSEPEMHPTDHEARNQSVYVWRLREELAYRVGVRKDRPEPRRPQSEAESQLARPPRNQRFAAQEAGQPAELGNDGWPAA